MFKQLRSLVNKIGEENGGAQLVLEKCWPKYCKIEPYFECLKDIAKVCEPYGSQKDKSLKLRQEVLDCIDSRKSEISASKIFKSAGISQRTV